MGLHLTGSSVTQLNNAFVPRWQPSHAYTAGDIVMAPDGTIVQRVSDGTSGSSYSGTNWTTLSGGVAVVTYSGSLSTARPSATLVVWEGFASQPTNYANGDIWLDPAAGAALLSGSSAPLVGAGNDGDFYIQTGASPALYGPKASGAWGSGVSLVGPAGSPLTIQDEGGSLSTAATTINFVGAGVTASGTGATKTVTIAGGSGSGIDKAAILGPAGTVRATANRLEAPMSAQSLTSGTLYLVGIALVAGDVVSAVNVRVNSSYTSLTHAWGVLTDANRVVLAVSSDDITNLATNSATKTWAFGSAYTVPTTGMYYVGVMLTGTGSIQAVTAGTTALGATPIGAGTSNTGATTPPSVGATMTALTAVGAPVPYIWLT